MMKERTQGIFHRFFEEHPELELLRAALLDALDLIVSTYREGGKLLVCGNGGSCADSEHIVGELMKGFMLRRPLSPELRERLAARFGPEGERIGKGLQCALPAISLGSHTSLLTAFSNDVDPQLAFAQQVLGYGRPGDLLIGLSTSGNSLNVCYALMTARVLGLATLVLTGEGGGRAAGLADRVLAVPDNRTFRVQEHHLALYHLLCAAAESELFEE